MKNREKTLEISYHFFLLFSSAHRGPHPASVRSRAAALGGGVGLRSALFPVVPLLLLSGPVLVPIRAPGVGQKTGGGAKMAYLWLKNSL